MAAWILVRSGRRNFQGWMQLIVFACGLSLSLVLECGKLIEFSKFLLSSNEYEPF